MPKSSTPLAAKKSFYYEFFKKCFFQDNLNFLPYENVGKRTRHYSSIVTKIMKKGLEEAKLGRIKEEIGDTNSNIRTFSATRWTVRAKSIKSILDNFSVFITAFEEDV